MLLNGGILTDQVLGFKEGELDNIQSNQTLLAQSPPKGHLMIRKILSLSQWILRDGRGMQ